MNYTVPANIKLEASHCPLGCMGGDELVLKGRDRLHDLPGEFSVVRCRSCGLMRTDPRPSLDTMSYYYPEYYGPYHSTRVAEGLKQNSPGSFWKHIARKTFQFNTGRLPIRTPGRMLEIGCASGVFLHYMAERGWDVAGIELSQRASEYARALGYSVHAGPLETAPNPNTLYDLVVGWMVFEHLHDPILALKKLFNWTKPDARLVISVPNAGSLEFKLLKNAWYALHLPNHLFHYTPKTLRAVLMRGGWVPEKIHHQRVLSNLFASIGYVLSDMGLRTFSINWLMNFPRNARKLHYVLYPLSSVLGALGQTGRMTVWARKLND